MDVTVEKNKDGEVIVFSGDLTVLYAQKLQTTLLDRLAQNSSLVLNLEHITGIDLTALQILYAAGQTAQLSNKHFALTTGSAPVLTQAVKMAGFSYYPPFNSRNDESPRPEPLESEKRDA